MSKLLLEVELVDKVSKASEQGVNAIKKIDAQAKRTKNSLAGIGDGFDKSIGLLEKRLDKLRSDPAGFKKLLKIKEEIKTQEKKLKQSTEGFGKGFKEGLFSWAGPWGGGRVWSNVAGTLIAETITEGLVEGIKKPIELFAEGIKDAFKAVSNEQQLRSGYSLTLGAKGGKEAREDAARFSKITAFSASQVQEQMLPLFRSGMRGQGARSAYALATDLAAARGKGADSEEVAKNVDLLSKIYLKGGISAKQVAGLGVEGVKDFSQQLAKALGTSPKDAMKRAAQPGAVDPQLLINVLSKAVEKQQGGMLGTGGALAGKSLAGAWNKLSTLPDEYLRKLADSGALDKIAGALTRAFDKLDPDGEEGKRIFAALDKAFDQVAGYIDTAFTPENIEAFAATIRKLIDLTADLIGGLKTAINLLSGETISKALFVGDEGDKKIAQLLFLKKQMATGQLAPLDVKQKQMEIKNLEKSLTPSERVDYQNKINPKPAGAALTSPLVATPTPAAKSSGGKVINLYQTNNTTFQGVEGEDATHTARKVGREVHRQSVSGLTSAAAEHGG